MSYLLPSINGLRAISILLVIASHVETYYHTENFSGQFGVNVFFILSGYLITRLLIFEEQKQGDINLKKFYIRRTLRIFPAYYFMLLVYFLMQVGGVLYMNSFSWITALTYTKYFQKPLDKQSGHAWSLAIEEHFYLIWPLVFQFLKKWRNWFAFAIVFTVPFFRIIGGKYGIDWMNELTIFTRMDALILISINYRNNLWFRILNTGVLNYIGLLSYSLYLWQQVFTLVPLGILSTPPYNLFCILGAALFSYYLIEKPFLRLKTRFKY